MSPSLCLSGRRVFGTLGSVQGELPWETVELLLSRSRRMRFQLTWAEKDIDAFVAELSNGALEGVPCSERGVHERQNDDWDGKADGLGEDAEGVSVADPFCALVDRVVGSGGDNQRVCLGWPRFAW